jgi:hypothetical protein
MVSASKYPAFRERHLRLKSTKSRNGTQGTHKATTNWVSAIPHVQEVGRIRVLRSAGYTAWELRILQNWRGRAQVSVNLVSAPKNWFPASSRPDRFTRSWRSKKSRVCNPDTTTIGSASWFIGPNDEHRASSMTDTSKADHGDRPGRGQDGDCGKRALSWTGPAPDRAELQEHDDQPCDTGRQRRERR